MLYIVGNRERKYTAVRISHLKEINVSDTTKLMLCSTEKDFVPIWAIWGYLIHVSVGSLDPGSGNPSKTTLDFFIIFKTHVGFSHGLHIQKEGTKPHTKIKPGIAWKLL